MNIQIKLNDINKLKLSHLSLLEYILLATTERKNIYVAGGAARSIMTGEKVSDIDIFFASMASFNETVEFFTNKKFKKIFECPERKLFSYKIGIHKVQLINKKIYKDVWDLLSSFDFTVTQFAVCDSFFYCTKQSIKDTKKRILRINNLTYPVATINRLFKYRKKGYAHAECLQYIVRELVESWQTLSDEEGLLYID